MNAVVYDHYGPPDILRLEEIDVPVPKSDQVLVKVHAVSINSWDWDMLTGTPWEYRFFGGLFRPKSRLLHGCDIAGRVVAVGSGVKNLQVGDAVFGDLAEGGWGAFAEYVCAREDQLFLKPARMTFEEAACLSHGGNLAVQGLVDAGGIEAGQKVLINGGCGATGSLAIQIAKGFETEVTAVDRTEKLDTMRALGADHVLDYTQEDFTRSGVRYDLIFDMKATRSVSDHARALRPGGAYVTVGGKTSCILPMPLLGRLFRDKRFHIVGYKANKDLPYLVEQFEAGRFRPVIDKLFPLEETADAFRYFGSGAFQGKVVVTVER